MTPTATLTPTATPTVTPTPEPTKSTFSPALLAAAGYQHIVQPGETLMSIGYRYSVSWDELASLNGLPDPDLLSIGQQLTVPALRFAPPLPHGHLPFGPQTDSYSPAARKEIVVELDKQLARAYENGRLVRTVSVSTGLPQTPTVKGEFSIYVKYEAQTMSGPGYFLPDVPYVMYFYKGYGLHGTYWHNNFGQPMSHGCVNLPTADAEWFYAWAEIGTPVLVEE
jgi:LysM repeat protein